MPVPSKESQHPYAWSASIYGHLRESADQFVPLAADAMAHSVEIHGQGKNVECVLFIPYK